jgi:hypothetical protein
LAFLWLLEGFRGAGAALRFAFFGTTPFGRFGPFEAVPGLRFLTTALRFVGIALLGCFRCEARVLSKDK